VRPGIPGLETQLLIVRAARRSYDTPFRKRTDVISEPTVTDLAAGDSQARNHGMCRGVAIVVNFLSFGTRSDA